MFFALILQISSYVFMSIVLLCVYSVRFDRAFFSSLLYVLIFKHAHDTMIQLKKIELFIRFFCFINLSVYFGQCHLLIEVHQQDIKSSILSFLHIYINQKQATIFFSSFNLFALSFLFSSSSGVAMMLLGNIVFY